jgi:enterochelin esterase-like enzyme
VIDRFRVRIDPETLRMVRVWLPGEPPVGVLYLTDGQNVFARRDRPTWRADETAERLIASGAIPPVAIVAIDAPRARRRWEEYLPYADPRNARARRFGADRFSDLVIPRAMSEIGRRHPEVTRARHAGIGGSSYGAVAALHTALRHPRTFDRLLIESAPLWVGDGRLIADAARGGGRWRAWVAVGGRESARMERASELVRLHRRLARALRTRSTVRWRIVPSARHHESAWAARLPDALRWLFGSD